MNTTRSPGQFVTFMAWFSIAMGVLGVVSGLMQTAMLPMMSATSLLQPLDGTDMTAPPALTWVFEHMQMLNFLSLLSSALFTWVSWALLKRREWARKAFIAFLVFGALSAVAGAFWCGHLFDGIGNDVVDGDPLFAQMQLALRMMLWLGAVAITLLHAGIIWELCAPKICEEFSQ
jgi:hypothetical protein